MTAPRTSTDWRLIGFVDGAVGADAMAVHRDDYMAGWRHGIGARRQDNVQRAMVDAELAQRHARPFEPTVEWRRPVTVRQTTRAPMRRHEPKPAGWGEVAFAAFCVAGWMALMGWMTVEAVRLAERIAAGG